jgi:hypothetical protein
MCKSSAFRLGEQDWQLPWWSYRANSKSVRTDEATFTTTTNSQHVSKNPLSAPAYTVEVGLYRPAKRSRSFG